METRVLRYFIAVAHEQSISAAAHYLHLSQPSLSRQLRELEKQLGVTLFFRGNRRITLTEEGLFLLAKAREIVSLVDKTQANFQTDVEGIRGDIHIGGGETHAMRLVAHTLKTLIHQHPHIQFHLYSGNADEVMQRLDGGLLDFGVVIEPTDKQKYDYLQLPAVDTWGVLMRKDDALAAQPSITPEDLWEKPLLISRQTTVSNEFSGWLGSDPKKLTVLGTYNLLYNATLMVEAGLGYALCLDRLANTSQESPLCFKPLRPKLEAGLHLIWKRHQAFSQASKAFLEQLRSTIKKS